MNHFCLPGYDSEQELLSCESAYIASVAADKTVGVFSICLEGDNINTVPTVTCEFNLRGHSAEITRIIWQCREAMLLVLCSDGIVYCWCLNTGHLQRRVKASSLFTLHGGDIDIDNRGSEEIMSSQHHIHAPGALSNFLRNRSFSMSDNADPIVRARTPSLVNFTCA